ncbi:hypothetical protein ILUMI_13747 [Ignelater luminosus]|uniref:GH18 domain-containing protein n=1 Tax=Ignelater luminosus TaxID=2038154 RepID=A0A8K0GB50_IGNLU|nr:hypothetical protein ILUMI_13747 [Ignelater luminosus]
MLNVLGGYQKFNNLKMSNPHLKTLLAVGGWNEGVETFSNMASSFDARQMFIQSCLQFLRQHGFDGIDLDWEYPSQRGGHPQDKENFTRLVQEMSAALHQFGYLLTAAVAAGKNSMALSYEVSQISRHLDFINLMTYDLHSCWDGTGRVGHNAPLYSNDEQNVNDCVQAWINAGADPRELVLGVAAYGRSYILTDPSHHRIGAPSSGIGQTETVDFDKIMGLLNSGWKREWDAQQQVPYIHAGNQWIGYDDSQSIKLKVDFAKRYGLGGVMMWSIDSDSPRGNPSFPLLRSMYSALY